MLGQNKKYYGKPTERMENTIAQAHIQSSGPIFHCMEL